MHYAGHNIAFRVKWALKASRRKKWAAGKNHVHFKKV